MKIIGYVLALLGLACLVFGVFFIIDGYSLKSWPQINGVIRKVTVRTDVSTSGDNRAHSRIYTYFPVVHYSYEVNGVNYESERYQLGTTHEKYSERSAANEAARKFEVDSPITVFYDPKDPSSAVLDTTFGWAVFAPVLIGLLFLATGLGISKIPMPAEPIMD